MTVTVTISITDQPDMVLAVRDSALEAIRFSFNPSQLADVAKLKALAAAFLSANADVADSKPNAADELRDGRKFAISASMWSVLGATKGLS